MIDVNDIIAYESGELSEDATVDLFQKLINSGEAWNLQGSYGRTAQRLLDEGLCRPAWDCGSGQCDPNTGCPDCSEPPAGGWHRAR